MVALVVESELVAVAPVAADVTAFAVVRMLLSSRSSSVLIALVMLFEVVAAVTDPSTSCTEPTAPAALIVAPEVSDSALLVETPVALAAWRLPVTSSVEVSMLSLSRSATTERMLFPETVPETVTPEAIVCTFPMMESPAADNCVLPSAAVSASLMTAAAPSPVMLLASNVIDCVLTLPVAPAV